MAWLKSTGGDVSESVSENGALLAAESGVAIGTEGKRYELHTTEKPDVAAGTMCRATCSRVRSADAATLMGKIRVWKKGLNEPPGVLHRLPKG